MAYTVTGPAGAFLFEPRDLNRWPRNAVPPGVRPELLRGITIHYAGGPLASFYRNRTLVQGDEALIGATIRSHNDRPGVTDVGYQLLVGRSGEVWEGRGIRAKNGANGPILNSIKNQYPAGTTTTNAFWASVFVCVGTDDGYDVMEPAQEESLIRVCAWLAQVYGIANPKVNGHRDVRSTSCPGADVYDALSDIQRAINNPFPPKPTPNPQEDTVQAVLTPQRMLDTRKGLQRPLRAGETIEVPFVANEVVINVTAVNPEADGFAVVWGPGSRPGTSNLNFRKGATTANLARTLTDNGVVRVWASAPCHLIVDLQAAG